MTVREVINRLKNAGFTVTEENCSIVCRKGDSTLYINENVDSLHASSQLIAAARGVVETEGGIW